ncbi:hypothetical protein DYI37_07720 [Fulvimarina endophytica]|uniref:Phage gp6-like head-tail connector protein n=1 Tax=Fulvimarina endophytica TaxID=2293836 RepID=A0A371X4S3_9HYPH|nr:phage head-tail connector protein [Fulvimarina endophytica]RFC64220.1 hypothetical protein DYI37_07720 [Fulvimarina endophytica]
MVAIDLGRTVSPVGLAEAKAWARIERGDEDEVLALLLGAASEAAESELGLAFGPRAFRLVMDEAPPDGWIAAPKRPVVSVDGVLAYDRRGEETSFDPRIHAAIAPDRASIRLSRAVFAAGANGIDVTVTAGLASEEVPAEVKQAILIAASAWFEMRLAVADGGVHTMPAEARRLLRPSRRVRL